MTRRGLVIASVLLTACLSAPARADELLIKHPGVHPDYAFEAEPHLVLGFAEPAWDKKWGDAGKGFGPGFRGTIELVDNGFISSINNSVGIGFGLDWLAIGSKHHTVWLPLVMQWNFWLSRNWSVFGEPGGAVYLGDKSGLSPVMYAGARLHFSDFAALTMRIGYPALAIGVSFLL
jgi:hypothetical protein